MVSVHLGGGVDGHVVGRRQRRGQRRGLLEAEVLGWPKLGGAVDPHPGPMPTPCVDAALGIGEVDTDADGSIHLYRKRPSG